MHLKTLAFTEWVLTDAHNIGARFDTPFAPKNESGESVLKNEVVLKTGPFDEATHWKQTVLVLPKRESKDTDDQEEVGENYFLHTVLPR